MHMAGTAFGMPVKMLSELNISHNRAPVFKAEVHSGGTHDGSCHLGRRQAELLCLDCRLVQPGMSGASEE